MRKKILSFVLAVVMVVSLFPSVEFGTAYANPTTNDTYIPLAVSGFNKDVVVEKEEKIVSGTALTSAAPFDGENEGAWWALYEEASGRTYGLPSNYEIKDPNKGNYYRLEPYNKNNVLQLYGRSSDSTANGSLEFAIQTGYDKIAFLGAGGNGAASFTAEITYTDGSTSRELAAEAPDWYLGTYNGFYQGPFGRVKLQADGGNETAGEVGYSGGPNLYEFTIDTDQFRAIKSIDFVYTGYSKDDDARLNIMAVSGVIPGNSYTVTYDANGGGLGTMVDITGLTSGYKYTLLENGYAPIKGYEFLGWSTSPQNETPETLLEAGEIIEINENITLYAQWSVSEGESNKHTHNDDAYTSVAVLSDYLGDGNIDIKQGSYHLNDDINNSMKLNITEGTVNICLNGYVLNADSITVSNRATLNILDCGTTEHKYESSTEMEWTPNDSGDKVITGGILHSKIVNEGTFNLEEGTICGVSGVAINNKETAAIGEKGAVIGNYNSAGNYDNEDSLPAVVYNGKGANFSNSGKINNNVANLHTVYNDGGVFTNELTGTINENIATTTSELTAAGGVANYATSSSKPSIFYNHGQINNNHSNRSSGGVLNKAGIFYNEKDGEICNNSADIHCGGVDNTSTDLSGNHYTDTAFYNYGKINNNVAHGTHETGTGHGGGIYNEQEAKIYNYGEICRNTAAGNGGGIYYTTGELYVGGASKVTDNTAGVPISNIFLGDGLTLKMDSEEPLTEGAKMGVHFGTNGTGTVSSGFADVHPYVAAGTYFFADSQNQIVLLKNGEVYLAESSNENKLAAAKETVEAVLDGYTASNNTKAEDIQAVVDEALREAGISDVTAIVTINKTDATTSTAGKVDVTVEISLDTESETVRVTKELVIEKLTTKVTVKFDVNDGEGEYEDVTKTAGDTLTAPAEPTREGYEFIGWTLEDGTAWVFGESGTKVTEDTTLYAAWAQTGSTVTGKVVVAGSGAAVSGASVVAKKGNLIYDEVTTNDDGEYSFANVPEGTYNLVITQGSKKMTTLVKVSGTGTEIRVDLVKMPADNINSTLDVKPGTPNVMVAGLDVVAKQKYEEAGEDIEVAMTIEAKIADVVANEDKVAIEEVAASQSENLSYMDIDINKYTVVAGVRQDGTEEAVREIDNTVQIIIPFDTEGKKDFKVYRYHTSDGTNFAVHTLSTTESNGEKIVVANGEIIVHAKKFSTYAIGYSIVTEDEDNNNDTPSYGGGGGSFDYSEIDKELKEQAKEETKGDVHFSDVPDQSWYYEAVQYVAKNKLMVGVSENNFAPMADTSRAMLVTILWRLENEPATSYDMTFTDVKDGEWYAEAIRWGASAKVISGYSTELFGPNDKLTREQFAAILWNYCKYKGIDVSIGENTNILSYTDAFNVGGWAMPAMQWACGSQLIGGIADGDSIKLDPQGSAVRAQAATILMRFCENEMK